MENTATDSEDPAQVQMQRGDADGQSTSREVLLANARRRFLRAGAVAVPAIITLRAAPVMAGGTCDNSGAT